MPNCNELIMSEEARDFIIQANLAKFTSLFDREDVCISCINETWCILHYGLDIGGIGDVGYVAIPKLYGLMDTTSFDEAGITETINQPALDVRGQGVLIGFVDTGIDYTLEAFKYAGGRTKIAAIWDQTIQREDNNIVSDDNGADTFQQLLQYGTVYTRTDIDRALQEQKNGADPYNIVPSRDTNGHGTFLAGVAAASKTADYVGAAPDAEILMVKLKPAKKYLRDYFLINEAAEAFEETDIMQGVRFLQNYAVSQRKPLVICMGLGTGAGPRTGASPLADYLNSLARQINTVVVTCMGNEANQRTHVSGTAASSTQPDEIELNVGEKERGFSMEIWAESLAVLSISILSPSGELVPRIPARLGAANIFNFLLEQTQVTVDYKIVETVSGYEVIFIRFIAPAQGIWKIRVYSLTNIEGVYNAWLPLRQFLSGETYFLDSDPETTLTEPAAAIRPISVGAYNHVTGAIYIDSGRGYTASNAVKPDFVAPGVEVYGPRAGGGFTRKTGTSVAAAHAAGAAALLLSWGTIYEEFSFIGTSEVKSILIRGAKRDSNTEYPNNTYGYGKMDVIESFITMRVN